MKTRALASGAAILIAACSASAPPADPVTTAGATAAAHHLLDLYADRRFSAAWDMILPAAQRQVDEVTWDGFYARCPGIRSGYRVLYTTLTGDPVDPSALVVVYLTRGRPSDASVISLTFDYLLGRWRYDPVDLTEFSHGSVAADLAAAQADGVCA